MSRAVYMGVCKHAPCAPANLGPSASSLGVGSQTMCINLAAGACGPGKVCKHPPKYVVLTY